MFSIKKYLEFTPDVRIETVPYTYLNHAFALCILVSFGLYLYYTIYNTNMDIKYMDIWIYFILYIQKIYTGKYIYIYGMFCIDESITKRRAKDIDIKIRVYVHHLFGISLNQNKNSF